MKHPFEQTFEELEANLQKNQAESDPSFIRPTNDFSQSVATTLAVGEEGGNDDFLATTLAVGEEGGATTEAFGEEGGMTPIVVEPGEATTLAIGEEGGSGEDFATTQAIGEEGGSGEDFATTQAIGEEGGSGEDFATTQAIGEEGGSGEGFATTLAIGEEGGSGEGFATTLAIGEEGGSGEGFATTLAIGEEGGTTTEIFDGMENGNTPIATTLAIGEEGGISEAIPTTLAIGEEGGNATPVPTTLALGEEGGISPLGVEPGEVTTLAVGEEGGMTTLAVGEEGGIAIPIDDGGITEPGSEEEEVTTLAVGEEGGNFNQEIYRQLYPDINAAINRGEFSSGLAHYTQFGEFEIERIGFFTGTDGNDIATAFGNNTRIVGVNALGYDAVNDEIIPNGFGAGEIDVLLGSSEVDGVDEFILGFSPDLPFYVGSGNLDLAIIKNFDVSFDRIKLPGVINDYSFEIVNDSVNISTASGDLIAIVEGVAPVVENVDLIFSS